MKNHFLLLIVLLIVLFNKSYSQDYIFFSDSPGPDYYDPSWGQATPPSLVELINQIKFPVSTTYFFSGVNSLKLHWSSKAGGDWRIAVAADGWIGHDVYPQDSISFYLYSETFMLKETLPKIFIEDTTNTITAKFNLSDYSEDISAHTWTRIFVPLSIFESNPGSADLTKIKTIFFSQSVADSAEHTLFIDEVRIIKKGNIDSIPPAVPAGVEAKGFEKHIDVSWTLNSEQDIQAYYIYRLENSSYVRVGQSPPDTKYFMDWTGTPGINPSYKVTAVDSSNNESEMSAVVSASTQEMNDEQFLDMLQGATFRYFWDYAHPVSGLARERTGSGNTVTSGGSGFGVMAILVGIERGFISREEGADRILKIVNFLNSADRFHGAWSHWLNGETGKVIPFSTFDNGGDLVETAFMAQGLLTARQYFNGSSNKEIQIRNTITLLWATIDWSWYRRNSSSNYLYWHWSPNYGWQMNFRLTGPNETMITYLLAIASPTHGIPPALYHAGWAGGSNYLNGKTFYGYPLYVGWDYGGPLFFAHYSFLGFDPRNKKDKYTNYFINNRNHTLINRAYCIANPEKHPGYDADTWGLTASDDPWGYSAHEPTAARDNGTITPTAALSSFPYTPVESMAALKNFYRTYGERLWGTYGFKDAFNPGQNWFAESYLAIDQGPIIVMVENYRTGLLWNNFMANPEIQTMLDSIGFVPDLTSAADESEIPLEFSLGNNYPNPFNPVTTIEYSIPQSSFVKLNVFDILGNEVASLVGEEKTAGNYKINFNASGLASGVYLYSLQAGSFSQSKKLILMK